jgi:EmrB/QacA subfamily drug resistance transporter
MSPRSNPTLPWIAGEAHPARRRILLVLCLCLLVTVIDNTVLNTALPTLARTLHAGTTGLQWITDAYTLAFAGLLVTAGALGDRFGRRRALTGGLIVFALGSAGAAVSGGTGSLIAARVVMGLGAAFVMPATLSILSGVFPAEERPGAIGAWSAVAGVGIVVGPTLGGFLLVHFAWNSIFWVNLPLVALALAGVATVVPTLAVDKAGPRLDFEGAALSALGLIALIDAVIEAPDRGWTSALTLGEAGAALAVLFAFAVWELRSPHPMIDLRVFTHRAFTAASGALAVTFFALFGSLFALTQYLQLVHGYSTLAAGIRALPFALAMGAVSPVSSGLARRLGLRVVIPAGLTFMGLGLLLLSAVSPTTAYPQLAVAVGVMGAGMGLVMAPASEAIMTVLPMEQQGVGSAVNDTVREIGGALGVAVIGSLVSAGYRRDLHLGGVAPGLAHAVRDSIASADVATQSASNGAAVAQAAHAAYTSAMSGGFEVAAAIALLGALGALLALPARIRPDAAGAPAAPEASLVGA